jgi:uncharacterized protein (UPF0332 family)
MFDHEDFRRLAARMLQNKCDAAESRTAISRCYYAAFGVAKRLLEPHVRFSKGAKCHEELQRAFANCASPTLQVIGRKLDELRGIRNDADYDADCRDVDDWTRARLEESKASRLIKEIKDAFSPANEAATLKEIRDGAKKSGAIQLK